MINKLAELFRYSLNTKEENFVNLEEEIRILTYYLEIEKIRFGKRLSVKINTADNCRKMKIPPLLLQPLIENAVKHGISPKTDGGKIEINIKKTENEYMITVENDGIPITGKNIQNNGFGLASIIKRLKLHYGEKASLTWKTEPQTEFKIKIPAE
ncbi:MAG: hypothetical protein CSB55_03150 [Candidatus Cloacimonadota bacterium]|nr:MAG: hypothetical protein CSB55_03150 [Candidatus Cloacimonadota bacterium]